MDGWLLFLTHTIAISIHLGHTSSHSRQGNNFQDIYYNHRVMDATGIPGMKLSFPGDKLVCRMLGLKE